MVVRARVGDDVGVQSQRDAAMLPAPIKVSRIDPKTMLHMYDEDVHPQPDGEYQVPGNCVRVLAPDTGVHERAKWESDVPRIAHNFGFPGTGTWSVAGDYRKSDLYRTADGKKYALGSDADGQSYDGIGPLPDWLTLLEQPNRFHNYVDGAWVFDAQAELESLINDKVAELSAACQAQIYSGFESSALGQVHHYPALDKDQQNLTASVLDSTVPGLPEGWLTPFWCADAGENWAFRMHTAGQIQAVGRDAKSVILACMAQNAALAQAARGVQDKAELAAIVWTVPDFN